jgi:hypothetical protein
MPPIPAKNGERNGTLPAEHRRLAGENAKTKPPTGLGYSICSISLNYPDRLDELELAV